MAPRRFSQQMDKRSLISADLTELAAEIEATTDDVTAAFTSKFAPSDMRQLALVAHNHMKPAMKEFIEVYSEVLSKFRITGTQTTMRMCKQMWGEDNPDIEYGLTCTSGPLGGDAQIAALMCMEDLGALIFFVDPLSAHPHQADIDSLIRLTNCGNIIVCANPTSAMSMMHTFKCALEKGNRGMIPSFFETLESPAVGEYKRQQELALKSVVAGKKTNDVAPQANDPAEPIGDRASVLLTLRHMSFDEDEENEDEDEDDFVVGTTVAFAPDVGKELPRANRSSKLHGIVIKDKKKQRGVLKKLGKSMKKLTTSVKSASSTSSRVLSGGVE